MFCLFCVVVLLNCSVFRMKSGEDGGETVRQALQIHSARIPMLSENPFFVAFVVVGVVRFCLFFFFCWAPVPMPGFIINASRFYLKFAQTNKHWIRRSLPPYSFCKRYQELETLFEKCLQYVCGIAHFSAFVYNIIICCVTLLRIPMENRTNNRLLPEKHECKIMPSERKYDKEHHVQ